MPEEKGKRTMEKKEIMIFEKGLFTDVLQNRRGRPKDRKDDAAFMVQGFPAAILPPYGRMGFKLAQT